jgi:hypothetical protein
MLPRPIDDNLKRDISRVEQTRQLLERIVDITRAIENMQASLNAVLVLGVASGELPEDGLNLYSMLSDNLHNLPLKQIECYYDNLEILIKKQLSRILTYAGVDFSTDEEIEFITRSSTPEEVDALELLDAFKRTAQMAVSLRVLLRKRGVATVGSTMPVSSHVIQQHLAHLQAHEQVQRSRICSKIGALQQELDLIIENPASPAAMKSMLKGVASHLQRDLEQLVRGVTVDRLSFTAEIEEILPTEKSTVEVDEIRIEAAAPPARAPGFSKRAVRWLNSPWDVTWDDLQEEG